VWLAFVSVQCVEALWIARPRALPSVSPSDAAARNDRMSRPTTVCEKEYS
jgi:hypothetical protein